MIKKFTVEGMSCAACSSSVERVVSRLDGVFKAEVSLMAKLLVCEYDETKVGDEAIITAISRAGFSACPYGMQKKEEKEKGIPAKTRLIVSLVFLIPLFYISMGGMLGAPLPNFLNAHSGGYLGGVLQLILTLPIVFVNVKFYISGTKALLRRVPNMDTLVALGSFVSLIYSVVLLALDLPDFIAGNGASHLHHLYFESAGTILVLVTLGKYIESRSEKKAGNALEALKELSPETVSVIKDGNETVISSYDLQVGDIFVIRTGDRVPADGVVVEGVGAFDESALTGEAIPVEKSEGAQILSASLCKNGYIKIRAEKVGGETTLSEIIRLVSDAGSGKAPIARLADKISGIFVPAVISIAALSFIIWLLCGADLYFALNIGVSVLVISCPCALGLATPVAITVGAGRLAKKGVLVCSAAILENLGAVDTVCFDKTGTVTEGEAYVTDIVPASGSDSKFLLDIAYSIENSSKHPLAEAMIRYGEDNSARLLPLEGFKTVAGKGIVALYQDKPIIASNLRYLEENSIAVDKEMASCASSLSMSGKTLLYFAYNGTLIGIIAVADKVRDTSRRAIEELKSINVSPVMLTGDSEASAMAVAADVGISEVRASLLPQDKEKAVSALVRSERYTAMCGDGINDSPALAAADIGIAVAAGADIAIDSADVILMKNDLRDISFALSYSRKVKRIIKENLFWAFIYNTLAIPVAAGVLYPAFGILLNPMLAAAAMSFSSLFVVTNALRLKK